MQFYCAAGVSIEITGQKILTKYRDEKTGATWIGRGKPPNWTAGKDRSEFLVDKPTAAPRGPFLAEMAAAAAAAQRGPAAQSMRSAVVLEALVGCIQPAPADLLRPMRSSNASSGGAG
ncbi:H-NS family nucleoid-associated regulatory protein [Sphingomonas sp. NCPPB 2930]